MPENRCYVITNDDEFKNAFSSFPEKLDFSQDLLVVYLFTDIYYGFNCKLDEITEKDDEITIIIIHEMAESSEGVDIPSTSMPTQRCVVVKLTNCMVKNVTVDLIYS